MDNKNNELLNGIVDIPNNASQDNTNLGNQSILEPTVEPLPTMNIVEPTPIVKDQESQISPVAAEVIDDVSLKMPQVEPSPVQNNDNLNYNFNFEMQGQPESVLEPASEVVDFSNSIEPTVNVAEPVVPESLIQDVQSSQMVEKPISESASVLEPVSEVIDFSNPIEPTVNVAEPVVPEPLIQDIQANQMVENSISDSVPVVGPASEIIDFSNSSELSASNIQENAVLNQSEISQQEKVVNHELLKNLTQDTNNLVNPSMIINPLGK